MRIRQFFLCLILFGLLGATAAPGAGAPEQGVWARFRLRQPKAPYYLLIKAYPHVPPWYMRQVAWPTGADQDQTIRVGAGEFTPWFNFKEYLGSSFPGRFNRSGGVAELPSVAVDVITDPRAPRVRLEIEIATRPDAAGVVRRLEEDYRTDETWTGRRAGFLISPNLEADAASLETAGEMSARRLRWAREATGNRHHGPRKLFVATRLWDLQREELNLQEAETLWLLGFNSVENQSAAIRRTGRFGVSEGTHEFLLDIRHNRQMIFDYIWKTYSKWRGDAARTFVSLSDEVTCMAFENNPLSLAVFHQWLKDQRIDPATLGAEKIEGVVQIETPEELKARQAVNDAAARRVFYYTSRFRQAALANNLRANSDAFHEFVSKDLLTNTLVADFPYFGGTGLGMGMRRKEGEGYPLAADWFQLVREASVDMISVEDWLGLQYMYGPELTWEGFQLLGFQTSIMRSAGRGERPIMGWVMPSDKVNLLLKSTSYLCQGAKHFYYWTYGPTATGTENYWSDLRAEYDGLAVFTRQLEAAESIIAPGRTRPTRLALLYSISSDLWQPFDYVHMLERRMTYFSLIHQQYLVDLLSEEDVEAGRLRDYDVLYTADPCIKVRTADAIRQWVEGGGWIYGTCAAGTRNEFGERVSGLADVFGIKADARETTQSGKFHRRGGLNGINYLDRITIAPNKLIAAGDFGVIGVKVEFTPETARVVGHFGDGRPAAAVNHFGKGMAMVVGACPAISYAKDARFVMAELKEQWPAAARSFINGMAGRRGVAPLVGLSSPVVEAGIYDAPSGTALALANFTYQPIKDLKVRVAVAQPPERVQSLQGEKLKELKFKVRKMEGSDRLLAPAGEKAKHVVSFSVDLGVNDVILLK